MSELEKLLCRIEGWPYGSDFTEEERDLLVRALRLAVAVQDIAHLPPR